MSRDDRPPTKEQRRQLDRMFDEEPLPLPGDGEVDISVVVDLTHGRVIVNFPDPVASLSFSPAEASDLADGLHQCSLEARGIS